MTDNRNAFWPRDRNRLFTTQGQIASTNNDPQTLASTNDDPGTDKRWVHTRYSNPGAISWWSRFKLSHKHWHSTHFMSHCVTGWVTCCTSNATLHMAWHLAWGNECGSWNYTLLLQVRQLFWVCAVSVFYVLTSSLTSSSTPPSYLCRPWLLQ